MGSREKDEADREVSTSRNSESYITFHDESLRISSKFMQIVSIKEKVHELLDIEGAKQARRWASELEEMAKRFSMWPILNPETVAMERPELVTRLMDLNRICEELSIKTTGATPYPVRKSSTAPRPKVSSRPPRKR